MIAAAHDQIPRRLSARDDETAAAKSPRSRKLSWDLLRVIAVVEVVLFHTTYLGPATKPPVPAAPFTWTYPFGASALLVISGYFAAATIRRYPRWQWWRRRLARLLPAYAAAVVIVFVLMRLFAPADLDLAHLRIADLVGNLLLLQQLLPNISFVDLSYWTLPIQVCGFTAIAVLAGSRLGRGRAAIAVLWAVMLIPLAVRWIWMGNGPAMWLVIAIEGTGLARAHLLVAGVAIWLWTERRISIGHLALLLATVLTAQKAHPPTDNSIVLLAAMLVLICLAAGLPSWELPGTSLLTRPVRWLAGCSYGIYLVHSSIGQLIAARLAEYGVSPWAWLTIVLATAVLLGWALTAWIERPAYAWLTRQRPTTAPAPVTAPVP